MSGRGVDQKFTLLPDDTKLVADGADTTRVVLRVTDEFGAIRPFANDAIKFQLEGPAEIIGDNPFALIGGTGAIWIRAKEQPGHRKTYRDAPGPGRSVANIRNRVSIRRVGLIEVAAGRCRSGGRRREIRQSNRPSLFYVCEI